MKEFFANKKNWLYVAMGGAGLALLVGMIVLLISMSGNRNTPVLPSETGGVAPITLPHTTQEGSTQVTTEETIPLETATLAPMILVPLMETESQEGASGGHNDNPGDNPASATQTRAYYSAPAGTYSPVRGYNRLPATTVHIRATTPPAGVWTTEAPTETDPSQSLESSIAPGNIEDSTTAYSTESVDPIATETETDTETTDSSTEAPTDPPTQAPADPPTQPPAESTDNTGGEGTP